MHDRHGRSKKLAILAVAVERHGDELLADFQQTYHIDLWRADWDHASAGWVAHMAALASQLPRDSRLVKAMSPAAANSPELHMLRRMELNQRLWHWAHTKGAESGANEPQPILLDGEEDALEAAQEEQRTASLEVAGAFGIQL